MKIQKNNENNEMDPEEVRNLMLRKMEHRASQIKRPHDRKMIKEKRRK